MAKVINQRIETLSALLDSNESQFNVENMSEIPIEHGNAINVESESSCSSTIKVEPLSMQKSNKFKSNSSISKQKCEAFNKRFKTSAELNIHNQMHTGDTWECPKKFTQSTDLTRLKRLHTGEKSFQCDLCPKKFTRSDQLTSHIRLHSGEKPFQCGICQMKFRDSSNFIRHRRTHTCEKPFHCDFCHMKFSQSSHLKRHKKIHARTRSNSFNQCEKSLSQLNSLHHKI